MKRILPRIAAATVFLAALVCASILVRAHRQPAQDIHVLEYPAITEHADEDAVSLNLFFEQMVDLLKDGYAPVLPKEMRRHRRFGTKFPQQAFMIVFDGMTDEEYALLDPLFTSYSLRAIVLPGGDGRTLSPKKKADAEASGRLQFFESRTGGPFGFRKGALDAPPFVLSADSDYSDIPCTLVAGGFHAYEATIHQNSDNPALFGELRFRHAIGPAVPYAVVAYGKDSMSPDAQQDFPPVAAGETVTVPLPAGIRFPVDVFVYDHSRAVYYFSKTIPQRDVVRLKGYTTPIGDPDESLPLDPD